MGKPSQLTNPVALLAVSLVPVVRGACYLIADLLPDWSISRTDVGPSLPYLPLWAVGIAWLALGLFMVSTLWVWRWFRASAALAVGGYLTWAVLYGVDLVVAPDVMSITSLAGYLAMVPTIITLVGIELDRDSVRYMDPAVHDRVISGVPPIERG